MSDLDSRPLKEEIDRTRTPASRALGARAEVATEIIRSTIEVSNVLAVLPGSDPLLRHEWVVVSAHFDHLGISGEVIFNGADDDASGTAAVVEIAEAFATSPVLPRRSVHFAFWNAEEEGLLGSRFFVE